MIPLIAICKMPQPPHDLRKHTIGILNVSISVRAVARALNINAMNRVRSRIKEFGATTNRPDDPRPPVMTLAQDHYFRILHLKDHPRPATPTADETVGLINHRISPQTSRN